ncbi:MAG: hypothetical protein II093_10060, partial [Selenomonas sp.]|nr:hypothetical protein [Selenomonas sp.]
FQTHVEMTLLFLSEPLAASGAPRATKVCRRARTAAVGTAAAIPSPSVGYSYPAIIISLNKIAVNHATAILYHWTQIVPQSVIL